MTEKLPPEDNTPEINSLGGVYKTRGYQKQSFKEYLEMKKRKKFQIPTVVKIIFSTPVILLFCVGVFVIPYITYLFFQADPFKPTPIVEEKKIDPILLKNIEN